MFIDPVQMGTTYIGKNPPLHCFNGWRSPCEPATQQSWETFNKGDTLLIISIISPKMIIQDQFVNTHYWKIIDIETLFKRAI